MRCKSTLVMRTTLIVIRTMAKSQPKINDRLMTEINSRCEGLSLFRSHIQKKRNVKYISIASGHYTFMTISQMMHVNPLIHSIFFLRHPFHRDHNAPCLFPPAPPQKKKKKKSSQKESMTKFFFFTKFFFMGGGGGGERGGQTSKLKVLVKMVNGNVRFYFGISLLRTLTSTTNWYGGM